MQIILLQCIYILKSNINQAFMEENITTDTNRIPNNLKGNLLIFINI